MRSPLPLLPALLALALPPLPAAAQSVDLEGTWYVLVHYVDDASPNPEQERWEDKVWEFEKKGSRMRWTEYPIVVFDDETGRFERRHTGQYARVLHHWEPDAGQLADIADGLQVNSRGSKRKTLRGSDAKGWRSGRATAAASASVVTYSELWTIEGMPTRPVFSRADFLSGARTDNMEGLTRYETAEVRDGGDLLLGSYVRDGHRHGTFRMMRSGEAGAVKGAKDQSELHEKAWRRTLETSPQARAEAQEQIEAQLVDAGVALSEEDLQEVSALAVQLFLQETPQEEMNERLRRRIAELTWGFAASDARHDDSVRYRWHFEASTPRRLLQGVSRDTKEMAAGRLIRYFRRTEDRKYAFDFELPEGTPVVAAREGIVRRVVDGHEKGGPQQGMAWKTNGVWISHADGTVAEYLHLRKGIDVEVGQSVEAGDVIGRSGATGQLVQPELLFAVLAMDDDGDLESVPIRFDDGTSEGVVPVMGMYYGGE